MNDQGRLTATNDEQVSFTPTGDGDLQCCFTFWVGPNHIHPYNPTIQ
jgi:hypothetical protein